MTWPPQLCLSARAPACVSGDPRGPSAGTRACWRGAGSWLFPSRVEWQLRGKPLSGKLSATAACRRSGRSLALGAAQLLRDAPHSFEKCVSPSTSVPSRTHDLFVAEVYAGLPRLSGARARACVCACAGRGRRGAQAAWPRAYLPRARALRCGVALLGALQAPGHLSEGHPCSRGYYQPLGDQPRWLRVNSLASRSP